MKKRTIIRIISRICFCIYMFFLVYFLFLSDDFGRTMGRGGYAYNLMPFQEIKRFIYYWDQIGIVNVMVNLFGNIIAFMPFGALIRWVLNKRVRWYQAIIYTFVFSLIVEVIQLVSKVGAFDVDDIILNTIGGLLGFIVYYILLLINRRSERE
ncbi:MAG: VanZ family protein [Lachnospiraceae bacterium]|nr:VanZ family protein [Lachnospiraceae bacterium]